MKEAADRMGFTEIIEKAGGSVVADTCMVVSPIEEMGYKITGVNSGKAANYLPGFCKQEVVFADINNLSGGAIMKGRMISPGKAKGVAIVSNEPIGFYGGFDIKTGIVIEKGHPLEGENVKDKILVFPCGKGSTVGSYVIYGLKEKWCMHQQELLTKKQKQLLQQV